MPSTTPRESTAPRLPRTWLSPLVPLASGQPSSTSGPKNKLPNRILPAPMEGITRGSFCRVLTTHGWVSSWITPFLRLSDTVPRPARLRRLLAPYLDLGLPLVVQLMGTRPEVLATVARRCLELGAVGIDFNAACPSPTVLRRGAGGALLRRPERLPGILTPLREACGQAGALFSIKLRTGWESPAEFADIAAAAAAVHPDFIVLHYRTVREMYHPAPDALRRFARARRALPDTLLLASGDLFSITYAIRLAALGLDGAAAARGLVRDPLLLRRIEAACAGVAAPPVWYTPERLRFLAEAAADAEATGGRRTGFLLELASHLFLDQPDVFATLAHVESPAELRQACLRMAEKTS